MTDPEILAEYLRLEREANARKQGADHVAIMKSVAATAGRTFSEVRRIVFSGTIMGPN